MDIQLASFSSSPAGQVMLSDSTLDPFVYNLKASHVLCSKNKYRIKAPSTFDFGKSSRFEIPRYGILNGAVLHVPLTVTASGGNTVTPTLNLGAMFCARVSITSNSREIEQLPDAASLVEVLELPIGQRDVIMDLSHNNESADIDSNKTIDLYIPINLSFFTNGMGSFINASFVENLEINVEVNTKDNLFTLAGTGAVAVDVANTEMLLYYLNMEEANLRKLEDQAYSLERPLSMA